MPYEKLCRIYTWVFVFKGFLLIRAVRKIKPYGMERKTPKK
jgi:hypothetical protein